MPDAVRERILRKYESVKKNPNDAAANGELGMVLHAHEQLESAGICYQRARILDPAAFRWAYYLGIVQAVSRNHSEAARNFESAAGLNPDYVPARVHLGKSLLESGDLQKSRRIYEGLVRENPGLAEAYYGLGRILAAGGQLTSAAERYRTACRLAGNFGPAQYALALALRDLGRVTESEKYFALYQENKNEGPQIDDPLLRDIEALKAGDALEHLKRGVHLESAGQLEESASEQERALEIDPQLLQAHINLISLYGRLGRMGKAEEHYRAGVRINSDQSELHYNFGVVLASQNRLTEAAAAFEHALQINPFYAEAHANLGQMFERQGRLEDAQRHYRFAIENKPNYRPAHFHLGRVMLARNRNREAIDIFSKAIGPEDEQTPLLLFGLATAYAGLGDRQRSLSYAREARQRAVSFGQKQLVAAIDRDLESFERANRAR